MKDVFRLTGRGTAVIGDRPIEGEFRHGEVVDVIRDGVVVLTSPAWVEMDGRVDMVALVLPDVEADVIPGDEIQAR